MRYDITFDSICLVLLILITFIAKTNDKLVPSQKKSYFRFILAGILFCTSDILAVISSSFSQELPSFSLYIFEQFYYFIILVVGNSFFLYIKHSVKRNIKFINELSDILAIIYLTLLLISPSFDLFYYFDENNLYHHGPFYYVAYITPSIYIIFGLILLIYNNSTFEKRHHISHHILLVITLAVTAIQILIPTILISSISIFSAALIFLFCFEAPDYYSLDIALKELKYSKQIEEEARTRAVKANEAKSRFLSSMSHEIRTPLNVIIGLQDIILRDSTEEQILDYAFKMQSASNTLLHTIDDILDFSNIEGGTTKLNPRVYSTEEFITTIINLEESVAKKKGLTFNFDIDKSLPKTLLGDDFRLRQITTNLLSNAIKYTPSGSITLTIKGSTNEDFLDLFVSVKDTGVGIKPENLDIIFKEFVRIEDKKTHGIEGTGLGLNACQSLLSMMHSKLNVESTYDVGSEFYFTVKQKIINQTPISSQISVKQNISSKKTPARILAPNAKILVVDDKELNRYVISSMLKDTLIHINAVNSGWDCIKEVENDSYDLILLDQMMPGLNGVETLHYLRDSHMCDNTPIVLLTADAIKGAKEEYLKEGFSAYLSKPVHQTDLEDTILSFLNKDLIKSNEETR